MDIAVLELLASRICHDLISPVGAVHNGVEFLEESGVTGGEDAIGLISHSAQMAAAQNYRQHFVLLLRCGWTRSKYKTPPMYRRCLPI